MTQTESASDSTKRFKGGEQFDATELTEGDRIAPKLVARAPGQLGNPIQPSQPGRDPEPTTKLVAATAINTMDDVHTAILVDGETGTMVRASRHDSNQAWSQKEADWKVRDVGTKAVVEDVHELTLADSDNPTDDDSAYIQEWANVVLGDMAAGYFDYADDIKMNGRTLTLSDFDGRKGVATISLEDE